VELLAFGGRCGVRLGVAWALATGRTGGLEEVSGVSLLQATLLNIKNPETTIQVAVLGKDFHIIKNPV
jgi:hypothetical protein